MICVWRFGRGATARQLFLALGTFIVLRYVYWRLTSTLPSAGSQPRAEFPALGLLLLFAAKALLRFILTISLIINADPLKREPPPTQTECDLPTVDVFIPSYNEEQRTFSAEIIHRRSRKSMDYPGIMAQLPQEANSRQPLFLGYAEIRTVTTLRRKRARSSPQSRSYERRAAEQAARADLAHEPPRLSGSSRLRTDPNAMSRYVEYAHRLFKLTEKWDLCRVKRSTGRRPDEHAGLGGVRHAEGKVWIRATGSWPNRSPSSWSTRFGCRLRGAASS